MGDLRSIRQRARIDFSTIFSPITRIKLVKLVVAIATHENWKIHQLDVKIAILN